MSDAARFARALRGAAQALVLEAELLKGRAEDLKTLAIELEGSHSIPVVPYSQNDPRWAGQVYAGATTFETAGCYVVCVAMLATFAGYLDEPPDTAAKMRKARCFNGAMLSYPDRIPRAYERLDWPPGAYYNRTGDRVSLEAWGKIVDHINMIGPLILKVDYRPGNYVFQSHFVLAVEVIDGGQNLGLIDPIDGQYATLLARYANPRDWIAQQAVFGYRGLRAL
jgi:hypothetical protein